MVTEIRLASPPQSQESDDVPEDQRCICFTIQDGGPKQECPAAHSTIHKTVQELRDMADKMDLTLKQQKDLIAATYDNWHDPSAASDVEKTKV